MKNAFYATWMLLLIGFVSGRASASESTNIDVQIIAHSQGPDHPSTSVSVTIRNIGSIPVYIPKALSPLVTPEGHLMTKIFEVQSANGENAKFIGRYVRVSPEDPSTFFMKIDPGQSASHDIDLAVDYDLSNGGEFVVSYKQSFSTTYSMNASGQIESDFHLQKSEVATIFADPSVASATPKKFRRYCGG